LLKLGSGLLQDLPEAVQREWLLSDGLGGYSSSTLIGLNTRRYHGLLVVACQPPVGRMVLLSKVEEVLIVSGQRHELSSNAYPGTVHPRGFERAVAFSLDPLPSVSFEAEGARLTRTIARIHKEPGVVLLYAYDGDRPATLELRPLIACRDHHALQHENPAIDPAVRREGGDVVVQPYLRCPALSIRVQGAEWRSDGVWYRNFEYAQEKHRGLDFREDLYSHGSFSLSLKPGQEVALLAYAGAIPPGRDTLALLQAERTRLRSLALGAESAVGDLRRASDAFLVERGAGGRTVIAGYHWFADWGRDTMIALPGLCLSTGRHREARAILEAFARLVDGGMIPNRFPDDGSAPEYNTVDAALWMVVAVGRYWEATEDGPFVLETLRPAVEAILEGYRRGTRHGIRMTPDGLITQGGAGLQLTWMDAKVDDRVITPRTGKPVEIQALWFNALLIGAALARHAGDASRATEWNRVAASCKKAFLEAFWIEERGYLADVVHEGVPDAKLRPNQLYAVGLPHVLLPRDKAESVLAAVESALLTPVGLRTLAPSDPAYRGRYTGGPAERDAAYHQGTVWPYLMGVYFDALIRLRGEDGKRQARLWLRDFEKHLEDFGVGFVCEVFDGDHPHAPGGTIAQAWSVGEILRIETRVAGRPASLPSEAAPPAR
jgi:predicted glycogen debranching enzyme